MGQVRLSVAAVNAPEIIRQQRLNRLAHQFLAAVTKQFLALRIHKKNLVFSVDGDDPL
jgi:hypothetical protein